MITRALLIVVEIVVRGGIASALVFLVPARIVACEGYRDMATNSGSVALAAVLLTLLITPPFAVIVLLLRRVIGSAILRALIGGALGLLLVFFFQHWGATQTESACLNPAWDDWHYLAIAGFGGAAALAAHLVVRVLRGLIGAGKPKPEV